MYSVADLSSSQGRDVDQAMTKSSPWAPNFRLHHCIHISPFPEKFATKVGQQIVLHRILQIDLRFPQTTVFSLVNFQNKRAFICYGKLLTNDNAAVWVNLEPILANSMQYSYFKIVEKIFKTAKSTVGKVPY